MAYPTAFAHRKNHKPVDYADEQEVASVLSAQEVREFKHHAGAWKSFPVSVTGQRPR